VRQLGAAARRFLVNLASATLLLPGAEQITYVDVDPLLRRVYGKTKQGAWFDHCCPAPRRGPIVDVDSAAAAGVRQVTQGGGLGHTTKVGAIRCCCGALAAGRHPLHTGRGAGDRGDPAARRVRPGVPRRLVTEALGTARETGAAGTILAVWGLGVLHTNTPEPQRDHQQFK